VSWADDYAAIGARYLDDHEPGWALNIDPDILSMESYCGCVLGQLNGDFFDGLRERGWTRGNAAALGLTLPADPRVDISTVQLEEEAWTELDRAWTALIRARHEQPSAEVTR
jgi:hypothetical protein